MKICYNITEDKGMFSGALILERNARAYFSGIDVAEGFMLIANEYYYFVDARSYYAVKDAIIKNGNVPVLYKSFDDVEKIIKENKIKTIYLDYENTSVAEYNIYKKLRLKIKDFSSTLKELRTIKSEKELEYISKACEIVQNAFYDTIKILRQGITEIEVSNFIEKQMIDNGAEGVSFETIVAFGKNSAIPHHVTDSTKLECNQPVLIDVGCKYKGYCSDLTRTVFFGKPDEEFLRSYEAVYTANVTAIDKISDGMKCSVAHNIACEVLNEYGLLDKFTHSLGHGVGLEIHEFPRLSTTSESTLKNGMVFTVEPGVYLNDKYGIRIEDTVLLENSKVRRLFTDEKKLIII
jgi:Xaa-Pro aminopeptidase